MTGCLTSSWCCGDWLMYHSAPISGMAALANASCFSASQDSSSCSVTGGAKKPYLNKQVFPIGFATNESFLCNLTLYSSDLTTLECYGMAKLKIYFH